MHCICLPTAGRAVKVAAPRSAARRLHSNFVALARRREPEHDMHKMLNVDAEPMMSDPGDLGRVAEEIVKEQEQLGGKAGGKDGGRGGRRGRTDPHKMLNADKDPLHSDPGSLGKLAPGVLERYENLDEVQHAGGAAIGRQHGEQAPDTTAFESPASKTAPASDLPEGGGSGEGGGAEGESNTLKTGSPATRETQHPGEVAQAVLVPEQKGFEGTGGVLLDVSHAIPHPYHGEGVGRREEVGPGHADHQQLGSRAASQGGPPVQGGEQLEHRSMDFDSFA